MQSELSFLFCGKENYQMEHIKLKKQILQVNNINKKLKFSFGTKKGRTKRTNME